MIGELLAALAAGLILAVGLAASKLVRVIFLDIIRHPLKRTRIEIHGKKDITVKIT